MRRREFIGLMSGAAAWPLAARAEQSTVRRLGILVPYAAGDKLTESHLALVRNELVQLGWDIGRNLLIEYRWADAALGGLQAAAKELVELKPDIILVRSTPATAAMLRTSRAVPMVFVVVSDPVGDGLVQSIAKPGGNVTGFTNVEASLGGKWLELLKEIAPQTTRVGIVYGKKTAAGGGNYYVRLIDRAAASFRLDVVPIPADEAAALEHGLEDFAREPRSSILVPPDATTTGHRMEIIELARRLRLPAVYAFRDFVAEGGLVSYGVDVADLYRRAAVYLDRILRGAEPSNLPVQAPTKFELVVNAKTAKQLELSVPPTLLARADEVIE